MSSPETDEKGTEAGKLLGFVLTLAAVPLIAGAVIFSSLVENGRIILKKEQMDNDC